jgi:hypothetical protein
MAGQDHPSEAKAEKAPPWLWTWSRQDVDGPKLAYHPASSARQAAERHAKDHHVPFGETVYVATDEGVKAYTVVLEPRP